MHPCLKTNLEEKVQMENYFRLKTKDQLQLSLKYYSRDPPNSDRAILKTTCDLIVNILKSETNINIFINVIAIDIVFAMEMCLSIIAS